MYDDLLGPRKTKIDIGKCSLCELGKRTGHKKSVHVYCESIRKYVHENQTSCLKFKRRKVDLIT